jgi:prepilin peptidase CpaA
MTSLIFACLFFSGAAFILVAAAVSDWRGMTIPNRYSFGLIGLFMIGAVLPDSVFDGVSVMSGLISGGAVFLVTLLLFASGAMGGGDTKLAGSVALLVGFDYLGLFLIIMAVSGGVLAAFALLVRKHPRFLPPTAATPEGQEKILDLSWLGQLRNGANKVPYGLAIAAGGIAVLFAQWLSPLL